MTHPFIPAPNTLRVVMTYNTYAGYAENVYHVQGSGPYTDIAGLAGVVRDTFLAWDSAHLAPIRVSNYFLKKITITDIGMEEGPGFEFTENQAGAAAQPGLPDNVTIAVKWTTGRSGRSYRGRTYHIGMAAAAVSADSIEGTHQAAYLSAYSSLPTAVAGMAGTPFGWTSGKLVVVSYRLNNAWRAEAAVTPVTGAVFSDWFLDSQRRRLAGRGS